MAVKVGITGGIGSGKSTVCKVFSCLGAPVYYADERARWLIEHDPQMREQILMLLGPEAYTGEGKYNTRFVSARVFGDKSLLDRLNAIVHPRVREDTRQWAAENQHYPVIVKEAAIMKKGADLDYIVSVISPESVRINRVLARDPNRSREQVEAIIASQEPETYFREIADFVVENREDILLIPQVLDIFQNLTSAAQASGVR